MVKNEWQLGAEFKQTQGEQHIWTKLNSRKKTRTRHILELKLGMEMEWKRDEWKVMEEAQAQAHMQAHQRVDLGQP